MKTMAVDLKPTDPGPMAQVRCILKCMPLSDYLELAQDAAPYLQELDTNKFIGDSAGSILCDSEEEAQNIFDRTVGDEGPTALNPYVGPANVYALMIGPDGLVTENT